jgi:hypothetical protein
MECRQAQHLHLLLDSDANGSHDALTRHLEACPECRQFAELAAEDADWSGRALTAVAAAVDREQPFHPPLALERRVRRLAHDRLTRARNTAGRRDAPPLVASPGGSPASAGFGRRLAAFLTAPLVVRPAWSFAAAAVLVLVSAAMLMRPGAGSPAFARVDFADGAFVAGAPEDPRAFDRFDQPVALRPGSVFRTAPGTRAFFSVGPAVVAAAGDTALTLGERATRLRLDRGRVWLDVQRDGRGFEIETPHGIVRVTGTRFGVTIDPARDTTLVEVAEGSVAVEGVAGDVTAVTAGAQLLADAAVVGAPSPRPGGTELPAWIGELAGDRRAVATVQYLPTFTGVGN